LTDDPEQDTASRKVGWCNFKPAVEAAWIELPAQLLKLKYGQQLSNLAFDFDLRTYAEAAQKALNALGSVLDEVGR
jgi:hypothetical protein